MEWVRKVDFGKFWNDNSKSVVEKGRLVAAELRAAFPAEWLDESSLHYDEELADIVWAFENISGFDDVTPVEEFDNWMEVLYDYGDTPVILKGSKRAKELWVSTF